MYDRTNSTNSTANLSFKITPPGAVDPCTAITNIPSCGQTISVELSFGLGYINTQCFGGNEYGEETIFTFTSSATGMFSLDMLSNNNGDPLLFAYKSASGGGQQHRMDLCG